MHIVINGWFVGQSTTGSGQYIHHLLDHLPRQAPTARLSLLLPVRQSNDRIGWRARWPTVEIIEQPLIALPQNLAKLWWEQVTMPRLARQLAADVLWVPYWAAPFWQPMPVAVTIHDLIPQLLPAYRGGRMQQLYTTLVSGTAQRAAAVLTVSHASARDIVEQLRVPGERVYVVYHGPNQEATTHSNAPMLAAIRQKYALPARFFLYLGGFDVRKNVKSTLYAYQRYLERAGDPAVKLVIAGKLPATDTSFFPDPRKIAAEVGLLEQVHFCGWIADEDKPALYALSTAYIFPSLYEGFGMMLLEAMNAGTPVVTSAESGMQSAES
ncbi:glycosyltransferase family 1 protein [soil metagenome]